MSEAAPIKILREALEEVLEIGCWQAVVGTEDWKCRWCHLTKVKASINAPHHEDCAYMLARAALANGGSEGQAPAKSGSQPTAAPTNPLKPSPQLLCKLGSIAVHAEELLSPKGHAFDHTALLMLFDEEVKQWIQQMNAMAMLPVKR